MLPKNNMQYYHAIASPTIQLIMEVLQQREALVGTLSPKNTTSCLWQD